MLREHSKYPPLWPTTPLLRESWVVVVKMVVGLRMYNLRHPPIRVKWGLVSAMGVVGAVMRVKIWGGITFQRPLFVCVHIVRFDVTVLG